MFLIPFYYHEINLLYCTYFLFLCYTHFKVAQLIIIKIKGLNWEIIFFLSGATAFALITYYFAFKTLSFQYNFLIFSLVFLSLCVNIRAKFIISSIGLTFILITNIHKLFTQTSFNLYNYNKMSNTKILLKQRTKYGLQEVIDFTPHQKENKRI